MPGVESWDGATYRRSLRLNHGNAVIAVSPGPSGPGPNAVMCTLHLDNVADAQAAVQRCRRMLDLDADPDTVETHFADDPILSTLVRKRPGLRSPGHPDGVELLTRAVLGQQVSVKGARTLAARLVAAIGEPLAVPVEGVTHTFPSAEAIAGCATGDFAMPAARARALINACAQLAAGRHRDRCRQRPRADLPSARSAAGHRPVDGELCRACERWGIPMSSCRPTSACATPCASIGVESEPDVTPPRSPSRGDRGARMRCTTCGPVCNEGDRRCMFHTITMHSPVGELRLIAGDRGLRAILWGAEDAARLASINEARPRRGPHRHCSIKAVAQLEEYFAGTRREFDLPLDPSRNTVPAIGMDGAAHDPVRRTMSYGEQARRLGDPNKARAVGAANGKNPLSIVVPCHRVIGSTGHLTGFGGGPRSEVVAAGSRTPAAADLTLSRRGVPGPAARAGPGRRPAWRAWRPCAWP